MTTIEYYRIDNQFNLNKVWINKNNTIIGQDNDGFIFLYLNYQWIKSKYDFLKIFIGLKQDIYCIKEDNKIFKYNIDENNNETLSHIYTVSNDDKIINDFLIDDTYIYIKYENNKLFRYHIKPSDSDTGELLKKDVITPLILGYNGIYSIINDKINYLKNDNWIQYIGQYKKYKYFEIKSEKIIGGITDENDLLIKLDGNPVKLNGKFKYFKLLNETQILCIKDDNSIYEIKFIFNDLINKITNICKNQQEVINNVKRLGDIFKVISNNNNNFIIHMKKLEILNNKFYTLQSFIYYHLLHSNHNGHEIPNSIRIIETLKIISQQIINTNTQLIDFLNIKKETNIILNQSLNTLLSILNTHSISYDSILEILKNNMLICDTPIDIIDILLSLRHSYDQSFITNILNDSHIINQTNLTEELDTIDEPNLTDELDTINKLSTMDNDETIRIEDEDEDEDEEVYVEDEEDDEIISDNDKTKKRKSYDDDSDNDIIQPSQPKKRFVMCNKSSPSLDEVTSLSSTSSSSQAEATNQFSPTKRPTLWNGLN